MYFKQKLAYMALGCLFTIIGYTLASLSGNPVNAQSQRDKSEPTIIDVDQVVCRELRVVNDDGKTAVYIGAISSGGFMTVDHANSKTVVNIGTTSDGGFMAVQHASGENAIAMGIGDTEKGFVTVRAKDRKGSIQLQVGEYGGSMTIFNKGEQNVLQAGVGNTGGGIIATRDKHGYKTGRLP